MIFPAAFWPPLFRPLARFAPHPRPVWNAICIDRLFAIAERNDRALEVEYTTARSIVNLGKRTKGKQWASPLLLEEACRALGGSYPNPLVRIAYTHIKNKMADIAGEAKSAEMNAFIRQEDPQLDMFELLGGKR